MKRRTKRLLITAAVVLALALAATIDYTAHRSISILSGVSFSGAYTDCNGKLLHVYLTDDDAYRVYKPVTEYSPEFIEALLLQEDRRFYSHHGINPAALWRAGVETYIKHSRRMGASTITMQTAKLKYHLYTKNFFGKCLQIVLALRLEFLYSKQEILDAYVNLAPCGKNIEGFEAASLYYFGCHINTIDLSQELLLCVLPQNPSSRAPSLKSVPQELLDARNRLFDTWLQSHPENESDATFMKVEPSFVCSFPDEAPHFTRMMELEREGNRFAATNVKTSKSQKFDRDHGLVTTTVDLQMQQTCRYLLEQYVRQRRNLGVNNAAILLINTKSMEVVADVGSSGFYDDAIEGQVDANLSKRSPGSTLKPFIYDLALEQGLIHYDTMLKDTPMTFSEYTPDNYGSTYKGPVKAWIALDDSRNIPAINLASQIKNPDLYDFLKTAGVWGLKEKEHYGLSIVLGSAEVTPFELVTLYAALTNGGVEQQVHVDKNKKFDNSTGIVIKNSRQIMTEQASFIVCKMLEKNPSPLSERPEFAKQIPIGYKTGTSIGFKDSWSVGFFGDYVLCVWIGNFDGTGNNAFVGRATAAPLFFSIADSIIAAYPSHFSTEERRIPKGVKQIEVCNVSGNLPGPDCPRTELSWFIPGTSPITKCKIHRRISIDTRTGYRTDEVDQPYVKSVVREFWPSDLQALFAEAGLPRLIPPDYPPKDRKLDVNESGYPPEIISPMGDTQYVFRAHDTSKNKIILSASADADTDELFWFDGSSFIARTKPGEKYEWTPQPGLYEVTVTDVKGRSSSRSISITLAE